MPHILESQQRWTTVTAMLRKRGSQPQTSAPLGMKSKSPQVTQPSLMLTHKEMNLKWQGWKSAELLGRINCSTGSHLSTNLSVLSFWTNPWQQLL